MQLFNEITLFDQNTNNINNEKLDKNSIISILNQLLNCNEIGKIKYNLKKIKENLNNYDGLIEYKNIKQDLDQIIDTITIERIKYYIKRLINSIEKQKTSKINDLDLYKWKQYNDIITDSLWIMEKRDNSGAHNGSYWGNFIPQIPNQLLQRYTKKNEWILDTFLGSGTI